VYIASRSQSKFNELANEARELSRNKADPELLSRLKFLPLDLSDMKSCVLAAEQFVAMEKRLDIVVANAALSVLVMSPLI
jgi:NAD(P)-dependent dehydrogenase (short-subunit alcohol dehydrogenase family)